MTTSPPIVLSLSGHDPTGGAGIQADIQALGGVGCHACTVITALTVQDSRDVDRLLPQSRKDFLEQARKVVADLSPAAVKIGLLASAEIAGAVAELLRELPSMPVVLDPVLAAGGGSPLAREDLVGAILDQLLPMTTVLTPNIPEAQMLAGVRGSPDECAGVLMRRGCPHVLITGTHDEGSERVVNRLYGRGKEAAWEWERLPHCYHGSGCTLASALAGYLAKGADVREAAYLAQQYTWSALQGGWRPGRGQHFPRRGIGT